MLVDLEGIVKISDFGCSKKLEESKLPYEQMGSLRSVRGTANWMAPEIIAPDGYSAKVDIWSFGCLLLEMFTGKKPYDEFEGEAQIFRQLGKMKPPTIPKNLSDTAISILTRCFLLYERN